MGSDRARISYDKRRRYRGVVSQQGRVTLEADQNEDRLIDAELLREETIDIVGRGGTPDNGFAVTPAADPFDITIGAGTMYVGGERIELASNLLYSQQSEWLDHVGDPDWVQPDQAGAQNELVYLYLEEHEVSAVEDTALLEVALGGPDTAQRLRLLQRIHRRFTTKATCEEAMAELVDALATDGLNRDPSTQQLTSPAALKVVYEDQGAAATLCEPETQGGYLGAENQLIRIQTPGPDADGNSTLVWGFDDSSFLYRVQVGADRLTLTLASSPVDDYHKPAQGQAVEILRTAAGLETGTDTTVETSPDDFVAAATGSLRTLQTGYDSTTKQVVLDLDQGGQPLDAAYTDANETPVVFMRVWQERLTFTPGQPVALGDTGVSVVLDAGGSPFHLGEYWQVAVRPKTPTEVYPVRYLEADANDPGEPPDGPRRWICPLAVIQWNGGTLATLEDCRNQFDNLVELSKRKGSGCCDIVVRPEDVHGTLQVVVDKFKGKQATICLAPGRYVLTEPLVLGPEHSGLTIEACHGGAHLAVEPGTEAAFKNGIITLVHADEVTLRGLHFELPHSPVVPVRGEQDAASFVRVIRSFRGQRASVFVSIGVRPVHCARLVVEECVFRFRLSPDQDVFGAGIFAGSECWGLTVHRNWFIRDEDYMHESRVTRVLIGYLLAPTSRRTKPVNATTNLSGWFAPSLLTDASFRDNQFHGLSIAALVHADCGLVELEDNTVRLCEFGFVFMSLRAWAYAALAKDVPRAEDIGAAEHVLSVFEAISEDPVLAVTGLYARTYPLPAQFVSRPVEMADVAASQPDLTQPVTAVAGSAAKSFAGQDAAAHVVTARTQTSVDRPKTELQKISRATVLHSVFEAAAVAQPRQAHGLGLSVHCTENDVDLRVDGLETGFALLTWDIEREAASAITLNGNRFRTRGPLPAVTLLLAERCAVAGNVIENEFTRGKRELRVGDSLVVIPEWNEQIETNEVTVTANVLYGPGWLPNRSGGWQSPLDQWYVFNAIS